MDAIKRIRVLPGIDVPIDYEYLVNKPKSDTTLSVRGAFADALSTGARFSAVNTRMDEDYATLTNNISNNSSAIQELINLNIQSQINAAKERITTLENSNKTISLRIDTEVGTIKNDIKTVGDRVTTLESLPTRVTNVENISNLNKTNVDKYYKEFMSYKSSNDFNYGELLTKIEELKKEIETLKPTEPGTEEPVV